jgi:starch synthase
LKVLSVVSEIYPLVKTGGLADVAGALPAALAHHGVETRTLVPGYPAVLSKLDAAETVHSFDHLFGEPARLLSATVAGLDLFILDAPHLFVRPGGPYTDSNRHDWDDNDRRFAALGLAGADIGRGLLADFVPDIVHAHDWQAGLAPAFIALAGGGPKTVMTIHNLAFQGTFPPDRFAGLGLPGEAFATDGVEFYGNVSFLKAGLYYADRITTVSPTYAMEIQTDGDGMGLGGLLRSRTADVSGILNGIDDGLWNPATDPLIASTYDVDNLDRRAANKAALQARFGLEPDPDMPLFGVVSRFSWQKGLDLLTDALPRLVDAGGQAVILGAGDHGMEAAFAHAAVSHTGRVAVHFAYDEGLAHLIQAGSDAILVPSRFEPCGLTQLCALRYGAIPGVARVGGLADTVIDANAVARAAGVATGIQFAPVTQDALDAALFRTLDLWRDRPAWRRMQENGMRTDVGWDHSAAEYVALFRSLAVQKEGSSG